MIGQDRICREEGRSDTTRCDTVPRPTCVCNLKPAHWGGRVFVGDAGGGEKITIDR